MHFHACRAVCKYLHSEDRSQKYFRHSNLKMPKKALVDYDFIKELSESINKKDKRHFRAKVKSSLNGSKRTKKIEEIRRILMAAAKDNKKSGKKRGSGTSKSSKPDKRRKTFTQFESGSGSASSSQSSSGSDSEGPSDNPKNNSEASSSSSASESDKGEKSNN